MAGAYLVDNQIAQPSKAAQDMEMAALLWKATEQQLKEAEAKLK
jgi:hypothetical protein